MGLLSFIKGCFKKEQPLKELRTSKMSIKHRISKLLQKEFTGTVAILYDGKPLRQFNTTVKAANRKHAANKINEGLSIKLLSVKQNQTK